MLDRVAAVTLASCREDPDLILQTERGGGQAMLLGRSAFGSFLGEERARMGQIVTASRMTLE